MADEIHFRMYREAKNAAFASNKEADQSASIMDDEHADHVNGSNKETDNAENIG